MGKSHIGSGSVSPGAIVAVKTARFTFADLGSFAALDLPANHRILDITVDIVEVWDSVTSDALEIGTQADPDLLGDVADLQVPGRSIVTPDAAQTIIWTDIGAQDVPVFLTITSVGGGLSTGIADLIIRYATNEDNF